MMERLTARNQNGLAFLVNVKNDEQEIDSPYPNTLRCILDCFERLAEYEDAEEEGRLVVLPCKAGDSIYPINIDRELNKPPLRVTGFRFSGFDNEGWIEIGLLKYKVSEIGKTVFLTHEEEALKNKIRNLARESSAT